MTNELGFLSKHPTTGKPGTSPFINIGINYMNQASRQWDNIMQIVKENCSMDFPVPIRMMTWNDYCTNERGFNHD